MNTLVLLIERGSAWSPEDWVVQLGGERGAFGQVVVERRPEWLRVLRDDRTLDDFETEERLRLADMMTEPETYLIEWRGSVLLEKLLRSVPPGTNVVVDNDHGLMVLSTKSRICRSIHG